MSPFKNMSPDAYRDNESRVTNFADTIRESAAKEKADITATAKKQLERYKDVSFTVNTEKDGYQLRIRESQNHDQSGVENHAIKK